MEAAVAQARLLGGSALTDALEAAAVRYQELSMPSAARRCYRDLCVATQRLEGREEVVRAARAHLLLVTLADSRISPDEVVEDLVAARRLIGWALENGEPIDELRPLLVEVASRLATSSFDVGDITAALDHLRDAAATVDAGGDTTCVLPDLVAVVSVVLEHNDLVDVADSLVQSAGRVGATTGTEWDLVSLLIRRSEVELANGLPGHAYRSLKTAVDAMDPADDARELEKAELLMRSGMLADELGEYALAAWDYGRARDIRARLLDERDPRLLLSRYNVAEIHRVSGRLDDAADEMRAIVDVARRSPDDVDSHFIAIVLKNLGYAESARGNKADAERVFAEGTRLPNLPLRTEAQLLLGLASTRLALHRAHRLSDELHRTATRLAEEFGQASLPVLGFQTQMARFLPLAEESTVLRETLAQLPESSDPNVGNLRRSSLLSLALCRIVAGDPHEAFDLLAQAEPLSEHQRAEAWRVSSSFESTDRSAEIDVIVPLLLALVVCELRDRPDAVQLAYRAAVASKRMQAEALLAQNELVLRGDTGLISTRDLAARLRELSGHNDDEAARRRELTALEAKLAMSVPRAALLQVFDRCAPECVSEAMDDGSVLVEFIRCRSIITTLGPTADAISEPAWYAAFVLPVDRPGDMQLFDLGPAEVIDDLVDRLVYDITGDELPSERWNENARELASRIWGPLEEATAQADVVLVAPDGPLCQVPFDALITTSGHPLLLSTTISLVATGRDLTRLQYRPNWRSGPGLVLAAPDFGEPGHPYEELPFAETEGRAVAHVVNANLVTSGEATKSLLLEAHDPEILHLVTHGFFIDDGVTYSGAARQVAGASEPLLDVGVALAGANLDARHGLVTGLDVLGMHLLGTDLVGLSSCYSGAGQPDPGEGLLTLGRSFLLAGARSVVWSHWRLDDEASTSLMTDYYRRLMAGFGRAQALRDSKLEMYAHMPARPDVWAGYCLQGDPGPLLRYRFLTPPDEHVYDTVHQARDGLVELPTDQRIMPMYEVHLGEEGPPVRYVSINMRNASLDEAYGELAEGQAALEHGQLDAAAQHFRQALHLAQENTRRPPRLLPYIQGRLAVTAGQQGDVLMCETLGDAAVRGLDALGVSSRELAICLDNLGIAKVNLGKTAEGVGYLRRARAMKAVLFQPGDAQIALTDTLIATAEEYLE